MLNKTFVCASLLSSLACAQGGTVVINEFVYDNLGGDAIEFVQKLFSKTIPWAASLSMFGVGFTGFSQPL